MKKNIRFYSMYSAFMSVIIFLFGAGLVGTASICQAQDSPWTTKRDMPTPRSHLSSCVVNGKIYVIGGNPNKGGCGSLPSQKVEVYDPLTNSWDTTKANMPTPRESLSCSAVNGKIYAIGGSQELCNGELTTVEEYDPLTDTWDTAKTPMQVPRRGLSTCVVNEKIYALGGYRPSTRTYLASVEVYDPITDTWITGSPMQKPRAWFGTGVVDGKIYAFGHGGIGGDITTEEYDPVTDTWIFKADMPAVVGPMAASSVNDLIYIFGGGNPNSGPHSDAWKYNPISDIWSSLSQMPTARDLAHASEVNGNIYVIGGNSSGFPFTPIAAVEEYNPHNDLLELIENVNVDKSYAIPGADSVLISTKMSDPTGITLFAEIEAPDQTPIDSLQLIDDGNHGDGSAGDSLFANFWPPVEESNYYIDLKVTRVDIDTVFHELDNMARFTTIGPVKVESYKIISSDTIPNHGDRLRYKLTLRSEGQTATATNVTTTLKSLDSCATISGFPDTYGDIAPGATALQSGSHGIIFSDTLTGCSNPMTTQILVEISSDGQVFWYDTLGIVVTDIEESKLKLPKTFALQQNYPNPFNPSTTIEFTLPKSELVELIVYNILGKEVLTLVSKRLNQGNHSYQFNGKNLASGVYYYQLMAGDYREVKKMILLK